MLVDTQLLNPSFDGYRLSPGLIAAQPALSLPAALDHTELIHADDICLARVTQRLHWQRLVSDPVNPDTVYFADTSHVHEVDLLTNPVTELVVQYETDHAASALIEAEPPSLVVCSSESGVQSIVACDGNGHLSLLQKEPGGAWRPLLTSWTLPQLPFEADSNSAQPISVLSAVAVPQGVLAVLSHSEDGPSRKPLFFLHIALLECFSDSARVVSVHSLTAAAPPTSTTFLSAGALAVTCSSSSSFISHKWVLWSDGEYKSIIAPPGEAPATVPAPAAAKEEHSGLFAEADDAEGQKGAVPDIDDEDEEEDNAVGQFVVKMSVSVDHTGLVTAEVAEAPTSLGSLLCFQGRFLGTAYDVDLPIFELSEHGEPRHTLTLDAMAYVLQGKKFRKFVHFSREGQVVAVAEPTGYVFVYSQPAASSRDRRHGRSAVIQFDGEVLGLQLSDKRIAILTPTQLLSYVIP
eukprot:TRINITY_DN11470_c0_g1_i1.p1 TRINITY_DN11470_c0_g1~~TRINITY_DN11470_c0_g1_i1.p1  ORF type:complete len:471 (+),score=87.28 TRINITY_DN11470_c0_g1_i1:26-1414(+)